MNIVLFDDQFIENLYPVTFTRPAAEMRVGILKISEKWSLRLKNEISWQTRKYLQDKYTHVIQDDNLYINGRLLPNEDIKQQILKLALNEVLVNGETILAARVQKFEPKEFSPQHFKNYKLVECQQEARKIDYPWDLFRFNGVELEVDYKLITKGRESAALSKTVGAIGVENIFVEESAKLEYVTINASAGPVYIGKNSEIMEGANIRGPFALLDHSQLKLGAKIYGPTTIGPYCKIGGELNNVVVFGFSNKAHDGFLGNSVVGEWCNIGAGTNSSNLKNNYANVKMWNYPQNKFVDTSLQFSGLIMGDHSKCGINTMFNTGTVIGVNCNLYGDGFQRSFIPDFSWGGPQGFTVFEPLKAFTVAERVMGRRGIGLSEIDKKILLEVFNLSSKNRNY